MDYYNKHYIKLDAISCIIKGFSDAFEQPEEEDICINEEAGRHFELLGRVNPPLVNMRGSHLYKYENGTIQETTEEEREAEAETGQLPVLKTQLIAKSKDNLEAYLVGNPITSSCHGGVAKQYTITKDKQALLTQMILITQVAINAGAEYQPSWNAQGEACTYDWTIAELQQLAFEIEAVVRPLVSHQQSIEADINNAETKEEVLAVNIEF